MTAVRPGSKKWNEFLDFEAEYLKEIGEFSDKNIKEIIEIRKEQLEEDFEEKNDLVFLLHQGIESIGFIKAKLEKKHMPTSPIKEDVCSVESLFIKYEHRNKGLATNFMDMLSSNIVEKKLASVVCAQISPDFFVAKNFLERQQFKFFEQGDQLIYYLPLLKKKVSKPKSSSKVSNKKGEKRVF